MRKPAVLCDFDGTVTVEEVSISLLDRFAGREWRKADRDLLAGRITLRENMAREFRNLRTPRAEMEDFVRTLHMRRGFPELVAASRAHHAPMYIISEGLDFYVDAFLRHHGISAICRTNHAVFTDDGISVEHPFSDSGCDHCGTCKKAQLTELGKKGYATVFIGDGISDRCPARYAEMLFARDGLLRYCRMEGIACTPYRDFNDVLREIGACFWK